MKQFIYLPIVFLMFVMTSCQIDDDFNSYTYRNEATIYNTGSKPFREILLMIKPYQQTDEGKKYLATDSLYNIVIKVNGVDWGSFKSFGQDIDNYQTELKDGMYFTDEVVKYAVRAPLQRNDFLTTAGEYAILLNNYFTLSPGDYICEVESFDIKLLNGEFRKVKPLILELLTVKENQQSSFLGDFEVLIR